MTTRKFPDLRWVDAAARSRARQRTAAAERPVVLDARTEDEYCRQSSADAARIDPYRPLLRPLKGMPQDVPIVVYCLGGLSGRPGCSLAKRTGIQQRAESRGRDFPVGQRRAADLQAGAQTTEVHPYQPRWGLMLESQHRIVAPPLEKRSAAP